MDNERPGFNLNLKETIPPAEYRFFECLKKGGVDFATGVPCGVQKHLIECLASDPEILHMPATREAEAIGIATGAYLAGRKPVLYMQNSGLLESINTLTSLVLPYEIPLLFTMAWRGVPGETAPQHFINGRATTEILEVLGIPYEVINKDNVEEIVGKSLANVEGSIPRPSAILIARGALK